MNRKVIGTLVLTCTAAVSVCSLQLFADDAKSPPAPAAGDMAAMMEAWTKFATPGPEHAQLAKSAGEWETFVEDLTPGMGNEKTTGTATAKMIMGGRYLQEDVKGTMMGQPYEGMAITGFDNQTKEYFSTWIDSMGTGIAYQKGKMVGGKMEMSGEMTCPMKDKPITMKSTFTPESADKHVMEMTMTDHDGKPMGAMRITYTRKK